MAIVTTGASTQRINFGNIAGGYVHKLYLTWINRADNLRGTLFGKFNDPYTQGWAASIENSTGYKLFFSNKFSGNDGLWFSNTALSTGLQHLAIEYNNSSTSNVPRMFINNVASSITTSTSPTGTNDEGTGSVTVGDEMTADANYGINGTYYAVTILNVLGLSTEQINGIIADAYNGKLAVPSFSRAIFAPALWNVQDGAVLGSSNIIRDLVSGAAGVPSGSPVGKGDSVLRIEGIN